MGTKSPWCNKRVPIGYNTEVRFKATVIAHTATDKESKRRIGFGLTAFGRHRSIINSNLTLCEEKRVQPVCFSSNNLRLRNLASNKRPGKKTEKCTEKNGEKNAWYHL